MSKKRTMIHGDDAVYVLYLLIICTVLIVLGSSLAFHG